MNYELHLPIERPTRNFKNGHFLKGHVPWNKGMKWDDFLSIDAQERCKKGLKNFDIYRPTKRPDVSARCRRKVIAVMDDGRWCCFDHAGEAAKCIGGFRENVARCCRLNQARGKGIWGEINTDHKHKGVRWYYENDNIWTTKIKQ